jgi:hypothetical protein
MGDIITDPTWPGTHWIRRCHETIQSIEDVPMLESQQQTNIPLIPLATQAILDTKQTLQVFREQSKHLKKEEFDAQVVELEHVILDKERIYARLQEPAAILKAYVYLQK